MNDIAQALSNSVDRDGKGGMRADLSMNNNKVTGLSPGVADTDAATVGQLNTGDGIPVGAMLDYWGTSPPDGWLFAAGQEISRTEYAELFAVIGTVGGAGNGSTTFNIPDCRGRVVAGKDNMGGTAAGRMTIPISGTTLGAAGGNQTTTLTTAQMPVHTHTGTTSDANTSGLSTPAPVNYSGLDTIYQPDVETHNHTFTTNSAGGGEAHNNVQPTIMSNKIIKVVA